MIERKLIEAFFYLSGCRNSMTLAAIIAARATSQENSAKALNIKAEAIASTPTSIKMRISRWATVRIYVPLHET